MFLLVIIFFIISLVDQEEARMAVAQNLKPTHAVDERLKGVANTVIAMDDRVAGTSSPNISFLRD